MLKRWNHELRGMGNPPEKMEFDDLDMELNESLIRVFSSIFKIKGNVVCLDDFQWCELMDIPKTDSQRKKYIGELFELYGRASEGNLNIIYLNPRFLKRNYSSLVETVIHELLHLKYPTKKEEEIYRLERQYAGRYDYTPDWMDTRQCGNCRDMRRRRR